MTKRPDIDLSGALVVITGGGSASAGPPPTPSPGGARVVVADIDEVAAKETAAELAAITPGAAAYALDVSTTTPSWPSPTPWSPSMASPMWW